MVGVQLRTRHKYWARIFAPMMVPPPMTSRDFVPIEGITAPLAAADNPPEIDTRAGEQPTGAQTGPRRRNASDVANGGDAQRDHTQYGR
jgi:hypothetical protein